MKNFILNLAGILLKKKNKCSYPFPRNFKGFIYPHKKTNNGIWCLESEGVEEKEFYQEDSLANNKILKIKKRFHRFRDLKSEWKTKRDILSHLKMPPCYSPLNLSFLRNEPLFIDIRKKRIKHFFLRLNHKNQSRFFPARLIHYAYSQLLAIYQGLLLHACCVVKDNQAYLFLGSSGTGKSTIARLSRRYRVLGDDVIAVRKIRNKYFSFATPWCQIRNLKIDSLEKAPLKAIFFLKKSQQISFKILPPEEALMRILSWHTHFFFYTEEPLAGKLFFTASNLVKSIPGFEMRFKKDTDFWPQLEGVVDTK